MFNARSVTAAALTTFSVQYMAGTSSSRAARISSVSAASMNGPP